MNKSLILLECKNLLLQKKAVIITAISEILDSMQNETKSSLGDKHETARAKMQTEHEKLEKQLHELNLQYQILEKINTTNNSNTVALGSLVKTNENYFFISVGLGKLIIQSNQIFAISSSAPIALMLLNKKIGEQFKFNGVQYSILSIE